MHKQNFYAIHLQKVGIVIVHKHRWFLCISVALLMLKS